MELGWLLIVCPHHPLDFIRSRETAFPSTWNPPRRGASSNGRERHAPGIARKGTLRFLTVTALIDSCLCRRLSVQNRRVSVRPACCSERSLKPTIWAMQFWFAHGVEVTLREQLVTQVILGILCHDLHPGERLPSTRELARRRSSLHLAITSSLLAGTSAARPFSPH